MFYVFISSPRPWAAKKEVRRIYFLETKERPSLYIWCYHGIPTCCFPLFLQSDGRKMITQTYVWVLVRGNAADPAIVVAHNCGAPSVSAPTILRACTSFPPCRGGEQEAKNAQSKFGSSLELGHIYILEV